MPNVNKVILIGNLTAEPEFRQLPSGDSVASFTLAMNRRYTNARGEQVEETTFVDIDIFRRSAEIVHQYVHKGDPIYVEGYLRQDRWVDKQTNQQRSRLKVVADNIQLLSARQNAAGTPDGGYGGAQFRQQYQPAAPQYGQVPVAPQYAQQPPPPQYAAQPPQYRAAQPVPPAAPMPAFQPQVAPPPPQAAAEPEAPQDDVPF